MSTEPNGPGKAAGKQRSGVFGGIGRQILLLFAALIIPIIIAYALTQYNHYQERIELELQASLEWAEAAGRAVETYMGTLRVVQSAVTAQIVTGGDDLSADDIEAILHEYAAYDETVVGYLWADGDGTLEAATIPGFRGLDVSDSEYFQRLASGEEWVVTNLVSLEGESPGFFVGRAARENGEVVGVIASLIAEDQLANVLSLTRIGPRVGSLVDAEGYIVYGLLETGPAELPSDLSLRRATEGSPVWGVLETGQPSVATSFYSEIGEQAYLAAAVPIGTTGWAAFAGVPREAVVAPLQAEMLRSALLLAVGLMVGIGGAWLLSRRLVSGLQDLSHGAQQVAEGRLEHDVVVKGDDELSLTAEAFNTMTQRLRQLEEERRRMAEVTAHDVRNAMLLISWASHRLEGAVGAGEEDSELRAKLDVIQEETSRMSTMISDMVESYQAPMDGYALEMAGVDLCEVLETAVRRYREVSPGHTVMVESSQQPLTVLGDGDRLYQVMDNLLSNAIKYSPVGGTITVRAAREDGHALISVSDQGIGIPSEETEHVFQGFYRGRSQVSSSLSGPEGMGLGLYICRRIIQSHEGRIWLQSEPGVGTTVFISLPLAESAPDQQQNQQEQAG